MTDEEIRLECLKLTLGTYPDVDLNKLNEPETSKYYCNVHKYRSELANQYFKFVTSGQTVEAIQLFWKCNDWNNVSED